MNINQALEQLKSINPNTLTGFINYFYDFYGKDGLYSDTINNLELGEIYAGVAYRKDKFEGDSVDRELIRDYILTMRGE